MADIPNVDPFMRVTVGVPVYTDDEQKIGTVKQIQGRAFKIGTGFLQRDYWLPATCVAVAVPGEPVMLSVAKGQLDQYKAADAADAAA
jgi:hypothetical protein